MSLRSTLDALFGSAWHVNHDSIMTALLPATDGAAEAAKPVTTDANKAVSGLGDVNATGNISTTGNVSGQSVYATAGGKTGYTTGAGGAVTQLTSRSTGVTLNKPCGRITTDTTSLAAGAHADFVVTNSLVLATDTIVANITSGGTGSPRVDVVGVAAGSFTLRVTNDHASTADTSADVINFAILKSVAA